MDVKTKVNCDVCDDEIASVLYKRLKAAWVKRRVIVLCNKCNRAFMGLKVPKHIPSKQILKYALERYDGHKI